MEKILQSLKDLAWSQALPALIIAVVGILIIRILIVVVTKTLEKSKLEKAAHALIKSLLRVACYLLLCLIVASKLGIDVTGIVALASVITLAVSLALQNALANVIGGFTLLSTHPFKSGDYVEVAGLAGTVTEITMSYTKLQTPDNKVISIPNSTVAASQVVNYSTMKTRRVDINVTASYDAPAETVLASLLEAAKMDHVLTEPAEPFAAVTGYGDSAISYTLRVWVPGDKYWDVYFALTKKVKVVFDANGVEMTYPHLNVHLDK